MKQTIAITYEITIVMISNSAPGVQKLSPYPFESQLMDQPMIILIVFVVVVVAFVGVAVACCNHCLKSNAFLNHFQENNFTNPWPDFTICFQNAVILNIPAAFMIITSLCHLPSLIVKPEFEPKFGKKFQSPLYRFKLVTCRFYRNVDLVYQYLV